MYVSLTSHKHFSKCAGAIYKYNFVIVYSTGGPGYKCGFYLLYISMVTWLLIQCARVVNDSLTKFSIL